MEMEDSEEASIREGYWAPEQPDTEMGACAMVKFTTHRYYPYAWHMSGCLNPQAFVCEAPAGVEGKECL